MKWLKTVDELSEWQRNQIRRAWNNPNVGLNAISRLCMIDKARPTNELVKEFAEYDGLPARKFVNGGMYGNEEK